MNCFPALMTNPAPWVRIMSCNPLELRDPDLPPTFSGYPIDDRTDWAELRRRVRADTPRDLGEVRRLRAGARRPAAARPGVHPRVRGPEPLRLSRGRGLPALAATGADVAPARVVGPRDRGPLGAAGGAPRPRRRADLPLPRLARLGRRGPDAAARRGARRDAAPLHRQQGTARRRVRAGREHGGRRPSAADEHHPRVRPRDHARREQHDDRGVPLRQADDRAPALLGSVRQRAAGARARLRGPAADVRRRGPRTAGRRGRAPRRHRPPSPDGGERRTDPRRRRQARRRGPHRRPRSPQTAPGGAERMPGRAASASRTSRARQAFRSRPSRTR